MTARTFRFIGLSVLGVALTGCVSQEKYNALKVAHDGLVERIGEADREAQAARAESEAYKQQLAMFGSSGNTKDAMLANLQQQNSELQRQYDELNQRYARAIDGLGKGQVLPPQVNDALQQWAQQNPELVDFDPSRGMVKFKSDLTFATGSAEVTSPARSAIQRFSQILNSAEARGYELMVVGHTDNTRVVNPATIQAGHKDNWHLSAHRAISVGTELQRQNVDPQRLMLAGCGEQRPIAPNSSNAGKAQNRRVEVLILPNTVRAGGMARSNGAAAATPAAARQSPAVRAPALNKDTVRMDTAPTGPSLNK
jgi:chemotaxis protein MotB